MTPPKSPFAAHEQWTISLKMALIVDEIWQTRNHIQFQDGGADVLNAKQNVQKKFLEILKVYSPIIHPPTGASLCKMVPTSSMLDQN